MHYETGERAYGGRTVSQSRGDGTSQGQVVAEEATKEIFGVHVMWNVERSEKIFLSASRDRKR
jgi:hypothetical protein